MNSIISVFLYYPMFLITVCELIVNYCVGAESLGPQDMCQDHEAKRTHRQCQISRHQQRRYSGKKAALYLDL